ncbi:MAG TPA: TonB-dependent receptor [Pyrinomonadaceae bacterium]|jgi:hypothetical protein|nr:TonB-dependent receptor [Pyrinomonadaceae bacterium]
MLMFIAPRVSEAQALYGSVTGNVQDANGAAIPGATVTITNKGTNQSREVTADESGGYTFTNVEAGKYDVKVNQQGFKTLTKTDVDVTINTTTRTDLALEAGQVAESVTVTAETAVLQTESAEVKEELSTVQLQNLPVPLGRNYQNLFATLPGFSELNEPHSIGSNPSRALEFNVNGASKSINNTRIDGASAANLWLPHITAYVPALESIQAVNVVTNSFDAEQGLAGGAAINVQIKTGTNDFRGSAFEYNTNHALSARPYNFSGPVRDVPKLVYNQFGGTFGGPIIKNKLFFFASYEGTTDHRNVENTTVDVPTSTIRTGDFRGLRDAQGRTINIYDPFTGQRDASGNFTGVGRTVISCNGVQNVICADRISPISQKILNLLPQPNRAGELDNYFVSGNRIFHRHTLDTKVNWNVSTNFSLFGRFSILDFNSDTPTVFGPELEGVEITGGSNPGIAFGNTYVFSTGGTYTMTPNFVIDGNFGFVRMNVSDVNPTTGKDIGTDFLGIPGTNGTEEFEKGFPRFAISSYSVIGTNSNVQPYYRNDDQYQYVVNFNYLRGNHSIRWGADIYQQQLNHIQPEVITGTTFGSRGGFDFGSGPTSLNVPTGTTAPAGVVSGTQFNSLATFLLGLPTQFGKLELNEFPITTRTNLYSLYIRDQWKITPKLTLSYGTRWEYFPIPTRADRGFERYDPETNQMLIGGIGDVPLDLGVKVSKTDFAPRLGVAWRPQEGLVIRAGFGITNDPYALGRPLRTNHPLLSNLVIQAPNGFSPAGTLAQGIPAVVNPGLGNGVIPIPGNVAAYALPDEFERGYIRSFNAFVQKELKWGFVGEVGYVGTRQINQLGFIELNYPTVGGGNASRVLNQRFGRSAQTNLIAPVGDSSYDAMQATLERRFASGVSLNANYTFSKAIGITENGNSDDSLRIRIPEYYDLNRSLLNHDRTHVFKVSNITELPFGKGRRWLNNGGFVAALVGGWQANNIIRFGSGTPFNVTANGNSLNAPDNTQRADQVKPDVEIFGNIGPGQKYFDTTAFAPVTVARFGTAGFNILRGPGYFVWDFGVFRRIQITERFDVQLRGETFNITNTPRFANPNTDINNTNVGTITGTFSGYVPRQFRFGLRLGF